MTCSKFYKNNLLAFENYLPVDRMQSEIILNMATRCQEARKGYLGSAEN